MVHVAGKQVCRTKQKNKQQNSKHQCNIHHQTEEWPFSLDVKEFERITSKRKASSLPPTKMANKMQRYEKEMKLFESEANLEVLTHVPLRPKSGYQYIYKWDSTARRKDWRADGYRWRQNATVKFSHGDAKCKRYYFKLKIGPGNDYTNEFSKHAIECSLYEKQLLIWYQGDNSVVVDFSHGNAKDTEKEFHRAAPSVLSETRSAKKKLPLQVYSELVLTAPEQSDSRIITDAPRNIQQIRNAQKSARHDERLSLDAICNLIELRSETHFVNDVHLAPKLLVICFKSSNCLPFITN
jgi:hypothetical protein